MHEPAEHTAATTSTGTETNIKRVSRPEGQGEQRHAADKDGGFPQEERPGDYKHLLDLPGVGRQPTGQFAHAVLGVERQRQAEQTAIGVAEVMPFADHAEPIGSQKGADGLAGENDHQQQGGEVQPGQVRRRRWPR